MRSVHWSNWAPRRSGLYECAKDMIKYERKLGIDSQMAIYETENPKNLMDDDWLIPVSWEETKDADIFIIHRGIPAGLEDKKKKTVLIIHGTIECLMLEEVFSNAESGIFNTHINLIKSYDVSVAVNQHDYEVYKLYDPADKLILIDDAIDTERFTLEGYKYPYTHHPQILWADSLRVNKFPAHIIWAMAEVVKKIPEARLTVVGLDLLSILTWRNLVLRSPKNLIAPNLENIQFSTDDIIPFMRGADMVFNSNVSGVPSRVEIEAMACGCQVVGYGDFTKWTAKPFDIKSIADKICECWEEVKDNPSRREEARQYVMNHHNAEKIVIEKFIPLYNKLLGKEE